MVTVQDLAKEYAKKYAGYLAYKEAYNNYIRIIDDYLEHRDTDTEYEYLTEKMEKQLTEPMQHQEI